MALADEQQLFRPDGGEANQQDSRDLGMVGEGTELFEFPQAEEHREETANELAPDPRMVPNQIENPIQTGAEEKGTEEARDGAAWAWSGLILSLLSFLVMPLFLGIVGIGLGYVGFRQGSRNIGVWAMGIGALSILASLLITPFFIR